MNYSPKDQKRPSPASKDIFLTPEEVSALLQVPTKTLAAWRSQRKGPLFHRYGVHVRYPASELDLWLSNKQDDAKNWMAS